MLKKERFYSQDDLAESHQCLKSWNEDLIWSMAESDSETSDDNLPPSLDAPPSVRPSTSGVERGWRGCLFRKEKVRRTKTILTLLFQRT